MSYQDALLHHLVRSIERDFGVTNVEQDDDGDFCVAGGDRPVWVRPLLCAETPLVKVWSPAVFGVKGSAALLREINDLNLNLCQVRVVYDDPVVVVASEVEAESVQPGQIGRLAGIVGSTSAGAGTMIAAVFGGEAAFAFVDDDEAADASPHEDNA